MLLKKILPQALKNYLIGLETRFLMTSHRKAKRLIGDVDEHWRQRIDDVLAAPDNEFISRHASAGNLESAAITMHNGVKVLATSYYGSGILNMLVENRGVHEPQEERAFEEIVSYLSPQCTMLELGSYWGFYSLSLLQSRPNAKCFLVEPRIRNLISGKLNFRLNNRKGHFTQALVAETPQKNPKAISVDSFCHKHRINHLNILHADIQGAEAAMLMGAKKMLDQKLIDYVFISTHSNDLHQECLNILFEENYTILVSVDLEETYSYDGLIVAKSKVDLPPSTIIVSKKKH
ncbi:MAG: hypothetical protein HKN76_16855 [Saprospiraceae bacterium]|nr:hypothetical protein [Saprospiraceae bacterium]